jgi:hypothetical protein
MSADFILGMPAKSIKSIQQGIVVWNPAANVTVKDVPITAVDLTKSIVFIGIWCDDALSNDVKVLGKLTTGSNINLSRVGVNAVSNLIVSYTVVEFRNIKSIQRGDAAIVAGSASVSISAVSNVNKAFCIPPSMKSSVTEDTDRVMTASVRLTAVNSLEIRSGVDSTVHYQVVEFK